MSKESYVRGFCKAAEAAGVDPQALAKFAASQSQESVFERLSGDTDTSPTRKDLSALATIDPEAVKSLAPTAHVGDYLRAMYDVNPHAASCYASLWNELGRKGNDKMLGLMSNEQIRTLLGKPLAMDKGSMPNTAKLNYATATNLIDRLGRKYGRPVWDVEKRVPTPFGAGLPLLHADGTEAVSAPAKK